MRGEVVPESEICKDVEWRQNASPMTWREGIGPSGPLDRLPDSGGSFLHAGDNRSLEFFRALRLCPSKS